ncbi:MAG: hypothetical protein ACRDSE_10790 [Pseudonocardiaceae bacterium]
MARRHHWLAPEGKKSLAAAQRMVLRAKIVLAAWRAEDNAVIARDLGVHLAPRPHLAPHASHPRHVLRQA